MLTLVLVAGLCADVGCIYMEVTEKFKIKSDYECVQIANFANRENAKNNKEPRFSCMEPARYRDLASREL